MMGMNTVILKEFWYMFGAAKANAGGQQPRRYHKDPLCSSK